MLLLNAGGHPNTGQLVGKIWFFLIWHEKTCSLVEIHNNSRILSIYYSKWLTGFSRGWTFRICAPARSLLWTSTRAVGDVYVAQVLLPVGLGGCVVAAARAERTKGRWGRVNVVNGVVEVEAVVGLSKSLHCRTFINAGTFQTWTNYKIILQHSCTYKLYIETVQKCCMLEILVAQILSFITFITN